MPGKHVGPGVWDGLNTYVDWNMVQIEGPVYYGANTRIHAGDRVIGPTWIGHGTHPRAGVRSSAACCLNTPALAPARLRLTGSRRKKNASTGVATLSTSATKMLRFVGEMRAPDGTTAKGDATSLSLSTFGVSKFR